jgi:flagellar hook-associated protein 1 FlgK
MSLSASLNAATAGLTLASRRTEVIASNVARADEPGYAKRQVVSDGTATGTSVARVVDPMLQQLRREAAADAAGAEVARGFAASLDRMVGDPDQPASLQSAYSRFATSLTVAAADPTSAAALAGSVEAAHAFSDRLNALAGEVTRMRQAAEDGIASDVSRLNADLRVVADLNGDIRRAEALGQDGADLADRRAAAIDRIAEIVPIRQIERGDGTLALVSLGGAVLLDVEPAGVGFDARQMVAPDQTHPTGLSGLTLRGRPAGSGRPGELFAGGALAARFSLRDETAVQAMAQLDTVAAEVAVRLQVSDASLSPTGAGIFTDAGARVGTPPDAGLAARLSVNDRLTGDGVFLLRDGLDAVLPTSAGDQLIAHSAALGQRRAPLGAALGTASTDMTELLAKLRSGLSSARITTETEAEGTRREAQRLMEARDGGVISVDEEMQALLRVEQAYAANARLIQAVGQMMDRLTEI